MANGVNIKMGVDGVSQFKQNMNQARQAVKTLDAQLALNEKQFKATGDAESYMQERTELLKAKLEDQKQVFENAEKALQEMSDRGVDRASKAYQDLYRQMVTAKGDLLDTQNALDKVADSGEDAANEVDGMNQQLKRIGDGVSWQNVTEGLGTIRSGLEKAANAAWTLGKRIVQATLGAGSWADELATTAAQYEVTPEELQRMRNTADIIDTSVEAIIGAKKRLKKGVAEASESTMGAFAELGVDPDRAKDAEDLFWKTGEALMAMGAEYDKEAYAQKLFGKSWNELIPLFQAGREEYEKTNASWSVVGQEQIDNLLKMDDAYQKMQNEWEAFKTTIEATLAGPLTESMDALTGLFRELNTYLETPEGQAMLKQIGDTVSSLILDLTSINPEEVIGGLKTIVDGITDGLKWVAENKETVIGALEAILAGWGILKVGEGITTILKVIDAVRGLTTGEASAAGSAIGGAWASAFAAAAMKASPFLAFLYTLMNPSSTSDSTGNNTLKDENGNLTKEAEEYGYTQDKNGDLVAPPQNVTDLKYDENIRKQKKATEINLTTDLKENAITKPFVELGENNIRFWNNFWTKEVPDALQTAGDYITNLLGLNQVKKTKQIDGQEWDLSSNKSVEDLLMGMNDRSDLQKAQLHNMLNGAFTSYGNYTWSELQRYWNGEPMDMGRIQAIMDSVTEAYERMEQTAQETQTENTQQRDSRKDMESVIKNMPEEVSGAVRKAMSGMNVYMDGEKVGELVTPYVNTVMAGVLLSV